MMKMSAFDRLTAFAGLGSNVWESTPSGMIPSRSMRSPPTFRTMFVSGETVVTTFNFLPDEVVVVPDADVVADFDVGVLSLVVLPQAIAAAITHKEPRRTIILRFKICSFTADPAGWD